MSWAIVAAVVGSGGVAGLLGSLLSGLLTRPKVRADAVAQLTDAALKQVNELQERTAEAERAATEARRDADEARKRMRSLASEIDAVLATLRSWRAQILAPSADLEQLRVMVQRDPGTPVNGHRRG